MRTEAKHGKGRTVEEHRALREALRTELSELLERKRGTKRVAVVGTGGVGANLVDGSKISKDPAVRTLVVTRESRKGRSGDQLVVDPEGIDVAAPPRKGLLAYEADGGDAIESDEFRDEVRGAIHDVGVVVVVSGLGGETGARGGVAVAQIAKDEGKFVFGLGVKPFSVEVERRGHAEAAEKSFKGLCDQYQCLDNDSLLKRPDVRAAKALASFSGYVDTVVKTFVVLQDMEYLKIIEDELDKELGPDHAPKLDYEGGREPAVSPGFEHHELIKADETMPAPPAESHAVQAHVDVEIHLEPDRGD